jgi:hypothetical protein
MNVAYSMFIWCTEFWLGHVITDFRVFFEESSALTLIFSFHVLFQFSLLMYFCFHDHLRILQLIQKCQRERTGNSGEHIPHATAK